MFLEVDVKCLIFDDVGMLESFHYQKIRLQAREVFVIEGEALNCKDFPVLSSLAFADDPVGALP